MNGVTATQDDYLKHSNRAKPYISSNKTIKQIPDSNFWHVMGPPSCLAASVKDLSKWLMLQLGLIKQDVVSTESLSKIQRPVDKNISLYAMGWWQADDEGLVCCHTGGVTGFESVIVMIPSLQTGMVISCNLSGKGFPFKIANQFVESILNPIWTSNVNK